MKTVVDLENMSKEEMIKLVLEKNEEVKEKEQSVKELSSELEQCIPSKISVEEEIEGKAFAEVVSRLIICQAAVPLP